MNTLMVSISEMCYSTESNDVIITYSLGSCLGVTAYDPVKKMGAMVHCLLPSAADSGVSGQDKPYMFVNTGVPMMVRVLMEQGADKERLVFKVAGGANMRSNDFFSTGKRNMEALVRLLDKNGVSLAAQAVGGTIPRTMLLHLDTGRVVVRSLGEESDL